ncbi:MAG: tripartite tricarboxylate transporter substrate binding protein [Burkholderiales bacterium]|nr:tripartite tricarboxylate transporter substrate binding protein [Burkholderiales bacterium]
MTIPDDPARHHARRRRLLGAAAAAPLAAGVSRSAPAQQGYPNRPIRAIVPVPAGGTLDLIGRQLGQRIQPVLGQPLVIENRSGAAGQVGVAAAARSPADGYTLLLANDPPFSILPALGSPMQFNPDTDFAPLSLLCQASLLLVVAGDFPASNLRELIAHVKANPGKIPYASAGVGSQHHIGMERFMGMAGLDMIHVPFAGIAPAFNSLLAGETKLLFAALTLPLPHIPTGKVKAIALSGARRHPLLPNVATFIELGYADYTVGAWFGMFAPAATPPDIVRRLSGVIWDAVSSREFIDNVLLKIGFDLDTAVSPERFPAFLRDDRARWKDAVSRIDPAKLKP